MEGRAYAVHKEGCGIKSNNFGYSISYGGDYGILAKLGQRANLCGTSTK